MAWRIEITRAAAKEISGLGSVAAARVYRFLKERLAVTSDPRIIGAPLTGPEYGALWKYRVGDYRIIAQIEDKTVSILVVRVGHRSNVYD